MILSLDDMVLANHPEDSCVVDRDGHYIYIAGRARARVKIKKGNKIKRTVSLIIGHCMGMIGA